MPALQGLHHFGLTVTDVERSARWYEDVLGLVEHRSSSTTRFDETSPGLDHLSFAVANRAELEHWCARLDDHGVERSPIARARSFPGAFVVVFRDPDNIQLEFFVET